MGSSGPLPPVPGRISPPKLAGTPRAGHVLRETHGKWSGGPTSFLYQWQRCNAAGRACAAIARATRQTYLLTARDAGHRIRVLESAFNITGTGPPAASVATRLVRPGVPVAATRLSLSGVGERKPSLTFTVTAGPGEPPLKSITLRLASFLDVSQANLALQRGIAVVARGRKLQFSAGITGRALALKLRKSSTSVRITIGPALISTSTSVARRVRERRLTHVTMLITVVETRGAHIQLRVKVPVG